MIPAFGGIYKRERKKTDNWPVRITTKAAPVGKPVPETAPAEGRERRANGSFTVPYVYPPLKTGEMAPELFSHTSLTSLPIVIIRWYVKKISKK